MINAIFSGFFQLITNIASVYLAPLNLVLSTFFPDLNNVLGIVSNVLNQVVSLLGWFVNLIPPNCRAVIVLIFTFWTGIWPTRVVVWNVSYGLNFIKRLNIFSSK